METSNPLLTSVEPWVETRFRATLQGILKKFTQQLIIITIITLLFAQYAVKNESFVLSILVGLAGVIATTIILYKINSNPEESESLFLPYTIGEGFSIAGVVSLTEMNAPGLALHALYITLSMAWIMLTLYRFKIIKPSKKLHAIVVSSSLALLIVFVLHIVLLAFGSGIPLLFEKGVIGIGFSVFICIIASLNLILDLGRIEQTTEQGVPKYFESYNAVALTFTLVWMYLSFLRLLVMLKKE